MDRLPLNPVPISPATKTATETDRPAGTGSSNALSELKLPPLRTVQRKSNTVAELPSSPKSTVIQIPAQTTVDVRLAQVPPGFPAPDGYLREPESRPPLEGATPPPPTAALRASDLLAPWSACDIALPAETRKELDTDRDSDEEEVRHKAYQESDNWKPTGRIGDQCENYTARYPFLTPPDKDGFLGRIGSYRVMEVIGEGGMGYVFLAEDKYLRRAVALKVMKPEVAKRKRCWGWFIDEASAADSLAR